VAPLAVGDHVDHQLAQEAVEAVAERSGVRLAYYEDYPYAADPEALATALGARPALVPETLPLGEADLAAKSDAAAAYASQVTSFWADEADMRQAFRAFALWTGGGMGPAERIWWPSPP
jgi:LmbE family N-acetylglucosaminyl deacetylase